MDGPFGKTSGRGTDLVISTEMGRSRSGVSPLLIHPPRPLAIGLIGMARCSHHPRVWAPSSGSIMVNLVGVENVCKCSPWDICGISLNNPTAGAGIFKLIQATVTIDTVATH